MDKIKAYSKKPAVKYVLLFIAIILLFAIFKQNNFQTFADDAPIKNLFKESTIKGIMLASLISLGIYGVYEGFHKRLTAAKVINLLIWAGLIMRIGYCLYTPTNARQHDLGDPFNYDPNNIDAHHSGYIYWFYTYFKMPETNFGQYYHPPLFHFLCGMLMRVVGIFSDNHTAIFGFSMAISCFAGCVTLMTAREILKELNLSANAQIPAMAIISFFPGLILVSGFINNESLAFMFVTLCILFTIRWAKNTDMKSIICLALSFGFGMMTKMSVAVFAIPTAIVMLVKFAKALKDKKDIKKYITQLAIFAVICVPLGMWFYIHNLIKYDQSLGYIYAPPRDPDVAATLWQRLTPLPINSPGESFTAPFAIVGKESNIWIIMAKTAMFGEFRFENSLFALILLFINIAFIVLSNAAMIVALKNTKSKSLMYLSLTAVITIINYAVFYLRFPYTCSANYRYISITAIIGAIFLAYCFENKCGCKFMSKIASVLSALTPVFCMLSILLLA